MSRSRILQCFHDSLRVFSLAISRPLRPVSPIWIMRALEAARTTRGDACAVITFSKRFSSNCRALKLFHVPSTTHAALPGRTFIKNHWHVTTNLAAYILRHYFDMFVEGPKSNTPRVLEIPRRSQIPSLDKPRSLHTGCIFELITTTDTDK